MSVNYAYNYAVVDVETHMCIEVRTCTNCYDGVVANGEMFIRIPTENDDYFFKYYDETTGKWYLDAAMTQEWIPTDVVE